MNGRKGNINATLNFPIGTTEKQSAGCNHHNKDDHYDNGNDKFCLGPGSTKFGSQGYYQANDDLGYERLGHKIQDIRPYNYKKSRLMSSVLSLILSICASLSLPSIPVAMETVTILVTSRKRC